MARDRVVERRAQMRSLSIVAGEPRVGLGDVGGRPLRRRPPILLWHGQHLERGLAAFAAPYGHFEDLGVAAGGGDVSLASTRKPSDGTLASIPEWNTTWLEPLRLIRRPGCPHSQEPSTAD